MVRSFRQYFLCSFSSLSCGQLARETAYCGSYCLQSDRTLLLTAFHWVGLCGWVCVNVWGGVHKVAGNAPRYHYSIIATYITEPLSFLFLYFLFPFLTRIYFFFSPSCFHGLHLSSPDLTAGLSPASRHNLWTPALNDNYCEGSILHSHTSMQQMPKQQEL